MKKIFVTGATGFVGKHLVKRLVDEGFDVTCLARTPNKNAFSQLPAVKWVRGDILNNDTVLKDEIEGHDTVYHLAGLIGYKRSLRDKMFDVNVKGTENVLKASIEAGVTNFIHMSSVAAIGCSLNPHVILDEDSPYSLAEFCFGYFDSKQSAEKRLIEISKNHTINTFILNPATIYGPGDSTKSSRSTQVKVALGRFPFCPPGGVNVVHIDDVVEACLCVVSNGKKNRRYILASDNLFIAEVFAQIAEYAKVNPPKIMLPKWFLFCLGATGDFLEKFGLSSNFSLENARVACCFHWFSNERARSELYINFKSSRVAIQDSVNSLLGRVEPD